MQNLNGRHLFILTALILGISLGSLASQAKVQSYMDLRNDSFISPDFEANSKANYQMFGAHLQSREGDNDSVRLNINGAVAVGNPLMNYFNIQEFYYDSSPNDKTKMIIGRRLFNWSDFDSRWKTGLIQPVFKWNPLSPESQGLTGIFWTEDKGDWDVTLYASPFFLPDQGPSFEIENGQFVRGNPWFRRPPESIRLLGEEVAIDYRFQKPNESQIVLQSNFGAKWSYHPEYSPLRFSLMHLYKPMNQIVLGYKGYYLIPNEKGVVDLEPQTLYHSLSGADIAWRSGYWEMHYSFLYDRPEESPRFDPEWTQPVFSKAYIHSAGVDFGTAKRKLSLAYMRIYGGEVSEKGDWADPNRPSITQHYPFSEAWQLGYGHYFALPGRQFINANLAYRVSPLNEFQTLEVDLYWQISQLWQVKALMSLVAAEELNPINQNEITQFRNNDRLVLGANYAF